MFNEVANDQDFVNLRGARQRGTGQRRILYMSFLFVILVLLVFVNIYIKLIFCYFKIYNFFDIYFYNLHFG